MNQATSCEFKFGANWTRFLSTINEERIDAAKDSIRSLLKVSELESARFLDAGSGSGLFSLAAIRLGADVTSIDIDDQCIACTSELQRRYGNETSAWSISEGSILSREFLESLGTFDVVYCWGVAHHTGQMWKALENLTNRVKPNGTIVLAIYNDEQYISQAWTSVKVLYNRLPGLLRPLVVIGVGTVAFAKRFLVTTAASLLRLITLRNPVAPFLNWIRASKSRGMHGWYDLVDWVGGYPFEVAKPETVFRFMRDRGFVLRELTTSQGHGCNEFVFDKSAG